MFSVLIGFLLLCAVQILRSPSVNVLSLGIEIAKTVGSSLDAAFIQLPSIGNCLVWTQEAFAELPPAAKEWASAAVQGTGVDAMLEEARAMQEQGAPKLARL